MRHPPQTRACVHVELGAQGTGGVMRRGGGSVGSRVHEGGNGRNAWPSDAGASRMAGCGKRGRAEGQQVVQISSHSSSGGRRSISRRCRHG